MLTVALWKWGDKYRSEAVNRVAWMLRKHLRLAHEIVCFTDDAAGLDASVRPEPLPCEHSYRALRRVKIFDRAMAAILGPRFVQFDLDVWIDSDITALLDRAEPVVCWRRPLGHYNPSLLMMDAGALGNIWDAAGRDLMAYLERAHRDGWPKRASDESVLNYSLFGRREALVEREPIASWTWRDGIVRVDYNDQTLRYHPARKPQDGERIVFFVADRNKAHLERFWQEFLRDSIHS